MQSADILRNAHLSNPATGMPSLALAHSEEISTTSSGVSFLLKMLIFCEVPIFGTPLPATDKQTENCIGTPLKTHIED